MYLNPQTDGAHESSLTMHVVDERPEESSTDIMMEGTHTGPDYVHGVSEAPISGKSVTNLMISNEGKRADNPTLVNGDVGSAGGNQFVPRRGSKAEKAKPVGGI